MIDILTELESKVDEILLDEDNKRSKLQTTRDLALTGAGVSGIAGAGLLVKHGKRRINDVTEQVSKRVGDISGEVEKAVKRAGEAAGETKKTVKHFRDAPSRAKAKARKRARGVLRAIGLRYK